MLGRSASNTEALKGAGLSAKGQPPVPGRSWPPHGGAARASGRSSRSPAAPVGVSGFDVGAIRHLRIGHDRSRGWIHQQPEPSKTLIPQCLAAWVPELNRIRKGLADHDRPPEPSKQASTQNPTVGHGMVRAKRALSLSWAHPDGFLLPFAAAGTSANNAGSNDVRRS